MILEIWNRADFGFQEKVLYYRLEIDSLKKSRLQVSGEGVRFCKTGTNFAEISSSLENGFCVAWSGIGLCPAYSEANL